MIKTVFDWVADALLAIGNACGMTYNEVNIIVYYLLIPLSWCVMFDCWLKKPVASIALILIWVGIFIGTRHNFSGWCDRAFQKSVDFLLWFDRLGGNYTLSSVLICVLVPLLIYGALAWLLISKV